MVKLAASRCVSLQTLDSACPVVQVAQKTRTSHPLAMQQLTVFASLTARGVPQMIACHSAYHRSRPRAAS